MSGQVRPKSLQYYGLVFAVLLLAWWVTGLVYTLGHTVFIGLLSQSVYGVLSYPIAGPFLVISGYLLSGHVHLSYHVLLVIVLGFGAGNVFGLLKKKLLR